MRESNESPESSDSESVAIGETSVLEGKRVQAALESRGVEVLLASDPEHCGSCSPKVMLSVRRVDLPAFQAYVAEERAKQFGGADALAAALASGPLRMDAVFDPAKEDATCPACGTVFSTRLTECPDCGLGFGGGMGE